MLLPVLAPEGDPGLDILVNFRPAIGDSREVKAMIKKVAKLKFSVK